MKVSKTCKVLKPTGIEKNILIRTENLRILENTLNTEIGVGELIGVIGPNGSGKTTFAKILCGQIHRYEGGVERQIDLSELSFSDYSADNDRFQYSHFYYQQRYNLSDEPDLETIRYFLKYDPGNAYAKNLVEAVLPPAILGKKLIELSSGETRKVLILKHLLKSARIYLLDNPFTGLDVNSIRVFAGLFEKITREYGKTILLLLNEDHPEVNFSRAIRLVKNEQSLLLLAPATIPFFTTPHHDFTIAFGIRNGLLKAGEKTLLENLNWTIRRGEKWLLQGANGAGKSMLMSLLNADNPVAYRLDIQLFDRKRGTGESIWDIKSKIGFVSPEIQMFWKPMHTVQQVVLSGFTDTIYVNRKIKPEEWRNYQWIIDALRLGFFEDHTFGSLSSGEKRMVMVARALVKNPAILILDEPFQGLDPLRFDFLHRFLANCADENRTVIQIAHLDREILPGINRRARIEAEKLHILK